MIRIVNGIAYDTHRAIKVIAVEGCLGTRTLYMAGNRKFFTVEPTGQISPMSRSEVHEFLEVHRDQIPARELRRIRLFFLPGYPPRSRNKIPPLAVTIAEHDGQQLMFYRTRRRFYIRFGEYQQAISRRDAWQWIEQHQEHLTSLDQIIALFPKSYRSWH